MPAVVATPPSVSTEEVLSDERKIDMDEQFKKLKPDQTQFTTMVDRLPSQAAIREKVNWIEEDLFPRVVQCAGAQTSGSTTLVLQAGQGKYVDVNDLIRNMRTGEMNRISAVSTDTLTIARVGAVAAAAVLDQDYFLVVADAQPQGSNFPNMRYLQRVLGFNYTQITRTTWQFTRTATEIALYGGSEPNKEAKRKAIEHQRKWEAIGFFGGRGFTAAVAPDQDPQGTAGGLLEFLNSTKLDANGPLTPIFFDTFLMNIFPWGTNDKVFFCAPVIALCMAQWNRSGMGLNWQPTPENVHGVHVDGFISGAYGYRVPVVVKKEWAEFPAGTTKGFGTYGFLVDMGNIKKRPLHATSLATNQQPVGKDAYAAGYLTESTYEISVSQAHGIIFGVTAPTS